MTTSEPEPVFRVETDQQLHAVGSLARHHVLRVLRDGPATVTQIADRLGIAKGSSHYHVGVLAKAGLIHVVETRKVRGVEERYYAMAATAIELPESGPGEPEHLMRHALADLESAQANDQKTVRLKHARLSPAAFGAFEASSAIRRSPPQTCSLPSTGHRTPCATGRDRNEGVRSAAAARDFPPHMGG